MKFDLNILGPIVLTALFIFGLQWVLNPPQESSSLSLSKEERKYQQQYLKLVKEIDNIKLELSKKQFVTSNEHQEQAVQATENTQTQIDDLAMQLETLRDEFNTTTEDRLTSELAKSDPKTISEYQLSHDEIMQRAEQIRMQTEALYVDTFNNEEFDPQWSGDAEAKTMQALSQADGKLMTRSVECHSSLCRLELARAEGVSDDEALDAFDMNINWKGEMYLNYDPNTGEATVYLARPGQALPILPNI